MIVIQAETGEIIMNPKEIYINMDLEGNLHLYADLSETDRRKSEELTAENYTNDELFDIMSELYNAMKSGPYTELAARQGNDIFIEMQDIIDAASEGWEPVTTQPAKA